MYDVVIIGKGPAGLSASLYTARGKLGTLVIGSNGSALMKAEKIENYFGFSEVVTGDFLLHEGEKQARRLGVEIVDDEVISIEKNDTIKVFTSKNTYKANAVLLATGSPRKKVNIQNLDSFEGRGISYCTTCDGFFYNNMKVGVVGFKDFAVHEALELTPYTEDITIFTNGEELDVSDHYLDKAEKFNIDTRKITRLEGKDFLENIYFHEGSNETIDGLFIANESASSSDFARKLGVMTEGEHITVDEFMQTNIEGIFAAGDCTGGFKQISTAVGQGAIAGKRIIDYIRSLKGF